MSALEPPPGCQACPGFIAEVGPTRQIWLRQDGTPTTVWQDRGIWPSQEALNEFLSRLP